jgi:hypothetical protein
MPMRFMDVQTSILKEVFNGRLLLHCLTLLVFDYQLKEES